MSELDSSVIRIEIGGGIRNLAGWINVDITDNADIKHDLNISPWPIADSYADEVYSSHCIEHVQSHFTFIRECARICKLGGLVTIKCPDPMSEMSFIWDHMGGFSETIVRHFDEFPNIWWNGLHRLALTSVTYGPEPHWFPRARRNPIFAGWSDNDIMTWIPRTKHENIFKFRVVEA